MSQNDFTIANQGFPAFRADLNSALQALASNSSGATAPSTTFANMWWYDSANNIMYIRNEDNDAWIKFAELDQTNDKFVLSGTLQLDDGTVSAPALTFNSDTNMGIYRGGTDILKFVTAGTDAITIDASQGVTLAGKLDVSSGTIKLDGNYPVGSSNVALGDTALDDGSLSGNYNTAIGAGVLTSNTSGSENTAIGRTSLGNNTTGSFNNAIGLGTLFQNTTGTRNFAGGRNALNANTTASENTAVGHNTLALNTTGASNVAVGAYALDANTTASDNTAVGYQALTANTTGSQNVGIGGDSLSANTTASNNVSVGYFSMDSNTTGTQNVAVGASALRNNTTSNDNTAVGYRSLYSNVTGEDNVAMGKDALFSNTGSYNVGIGENALSSNSIGSSNVSVGRRSLFSNTTAGENTAVGNGTMYSNTTGTFNVALGAASLYSNTTASNNTAVGYTAGYSLTTGVGNTFIGCTYGSVGAGYFVTTGSKNTIIGGFHGNQDGLDIRTSDNNIVLSDGDGNVKLWISSNRRTFIGGRATNLTGAVNIAGEIGASFKAIAFQNTNGGGEVGSITTTSSSTAYNTSSDHRLKENVVDMTGAIDRVKQLSPKRFNFIADADTIVDGFLAHEAQSVVAEAVTGTHNEVDDDDNPIMQGIDQSKLVPLLTGALKEAIAKIEDLEAKVTALENA